MKRILLDHEPAEAEEVVTPINDLASPSRAAGVPAVWSRTGSQAATWWPALRAGKCTQAGSSRRPMREQETLLNISSFHVAIEMTRRSGGAPVCC